MPKTNCVATRQSEQVRASRQIFFLLVFSTLILALPASAQTMSVKDYEALPIHEQSVYSGNFIEKMTADIGQSNPKLMRDIRDWFAKTPPGQRFPEGVHKFNMELWALDDLAKEGKIDLSKIQIEGVIVKIVKEKFPPPNGK
jgi:hypothetical protein